MHWSIAQNISLLNTWREFCLIQQFHKRESTVSGGPLIPRIALPNDKHKIGFSLGDSEVPQV